MSKHLGRKNEKERTIMQFLKMVTSSCILFILTMLLVSSATAHYFLHTPERDMKINDFDLHRFAFDDMGNLYIAGQRRGVESVYFVRKYTGGAIQWSSEIDFGIYRNSCYDMVVYNGYLYVCGTVQKRDGTLIYQVIFELEKGKKVDKRFYGDQFDQAIEAPKTSISHLSLNKDGSVLAVLIKERVRRETSTIIRYDQGFIRTRIVYSHGCISTATSDKDGNIYVAAMSGAYRSPTLYLAKFTAGGTKIKEKSYPATFDKQPSAIAVDNDGCVYLVVDSYLIYCYDEREMAATICTPTRFELRKYDDRLNLEWTEAVENEPANTYNSNVQLHVADDVYVTGTSVYVDIGRIPSGIGAAKGHSVWIDDTIYSFIVCYGKEGQRRSRYHYNNNYNLCAQIYERKNVRLATLDEPIDQMRFAFGISNFKNSVIKDFWIPKKIAITVNLSHEWNLFALPVYADDAIYAYELTKKIPISGIWEFELSTGYHSLRADETLTAGKGYWIKTDKDFSKTFVGTEVLGIDYKIDVGQKQTWLLTGGCTYPFHSDSIKALLSYHPRSTHGYYKVLRDGEVLMPGLGCWGLYTTNSEDKTIINIHVNQNERKK